MKITTKTANGTSFYGSTIIATPNQLKSILGPPSFIADGIEDKVNLIWDCETDQGEVFTIYDWKEYRTVHMDEKITFNIGGFKSSVTEKIKWNLSLALELQIHHN